jgi:hypothetical protein
MRTYYDHERAYRMIVEAGGTGWDDGDIDFDVFGFDPVTFLSRHGNRYLVGETELDAELAAAGFDIVFRQTRPHLDQPIGHGLVRIARRQNTSTQAQLLGGAGGGAV